MIPNSGYWVAVYWLNDKYRATFCTFSQETVQTPHREPVAGPYRRRADAIRAADRLNDAAGLPRVTPTFLRVAA